MLKTIKGPVRISQAERVREEVGRPHHSLLLGEGAVLLRGGGGSASSILGKEGSLVPCDGNLGSASEFLLFNNKWMRAAWACQTNSLHKNSTVGMRSIYPPSALRENVPTGRAAWEGGPACRSHECLVRIRVPAFADRSRSRSCGAAVLEAASQGGGGRAFVG